MKSLTLPTLALLLVGLFNASSVWAQPTFGGGNGSAKNPYLINSSLHWDELANQIADGNTFSGMFFRLEHDIVVSTMLGTETTTDRIYSFSGTFDGYGHKLTFNYTAAQNEELVAPFRFVNNCTIQNLHVDGTISTANKFAGGLAGRTFGSSFIRGCRVSTVILSSVAGDGTHGGIVALKPEYYTSYLTIEGCVYDGKILSTGSTPTTNCGGFVGFTSYGSLTIKNCIYDPAAPAEGETAVTSEATLYRYSTKYPGTINISNCYYNEPLGKIQGKLMHKIIIPNTFTILPKGNATSFDASGIIAYNGNQCLKYNDVVYAGEGDVVELSFSHNYTGSTAYYEVNYDSKNILKDNGDGFYSLTMPDADINVGVSMVPPAINSDGIEGSGTQTAPYIINNADKWDMIVALVNNGKEHYAKAWYILSDNITANTMMGNETYKFQGHVDGNGKTLTVNFDTENEFVAPFRYVSNAEICNLTVAGTIKTSRKFAAGFIADNVGNTTIANCRSYVVMNSTLIGDGTHGGFVALNTEGTLIIEGCVFNGKMLGGNTYNCAGFVGFNETNNNSKVIIRNSIFTPTSTSMRIDKTFVRSRNFNEGVITLENCYSTAYYNDNQNVLVYRIYAEEGVSVTCVSSSSIDYSHSGIRIFDNGILSYDGTILAKKGNLVPLNLEYTGSAPSGFTRTGFDTTAGTLSGDLDHGYTLKMGEADATIYATFEVDDTIYPGSGTGTSNDPYIIQTVDQWEYITYLIYYGSNKFASACYKLNNDLSVSTMLGTDLINFKGDFNGNGKTLEVNYGTDDSPFNEEYCAPFRYIDGANIYNLRVVGNIYTKKTFAAGLAGHALGENSINNCQVSVNINSRVDGDGTHGGYIANIQGGTTSITNCAFVGSMNGSNTYCLGGFVGWTESENRASVTFQNCLFAPSSLNVNFLENATFSRGNYKNIANINLTDCYYICLLGQAQGEKAYLSETGLSLPCLQKEIAGVNFFVPVELVKEVKASDITTSQATISWTGSELCTSYKLRYRPAGFDVLYFKDFETEDDLDGWSFIDADGDGYCWLFDNINTEYGHSGIHFIYSSSYNGLSLIPDNWLISPELELKGTLKIWLRGISLKDYREHFAIYADTEGEFISDGTPSSTMVELMHETETVDEYKEYSFDLSRFNGQKGKIAIRHFNTYDQYRLLLDDFGIYE